MTIIELKQLYHFNQIKDNVKLSKAKNILESIELIESEAVTFEQFISTIENEITDLVTRDSLKGYDQTNKNEANFNSGIKVLIELMEKSGYSTLKKYISTFLDSLEKDTQNEAYIEYRESKHPYINLYSDRFEIKAVDQSNFKTFYFINISSLKLIDPEDQISYLWHPDQALLEKIFGQIELTIADNAKETYIYYLPKKFENHFIPVYKKLMFGIMYDRYDFQKVDLATFNYKLT